jgi:uncharacterized membrane protein
MWSRSLCKANAKAALRGQLGVAVFVCFSWVILFHRIGYYFYKNGFSYLRIGEGKARPNIGPAYLFILLVSVLIILAGHFLVGNVLTVGLARFFMENRHGTASFSTLFFGFSHHWRNIVAVMFFRDVQVLLWSLLLVVPGIYMAYQYRMVPYLLAENSALPPQRAMHLSREAMQNETRSTVLLDLSFIGWFLGGTLLLTVGAYFAMAYYLATCAELYAALRVKLLTMGEADEQELSGFPEDPFAPLEEPEDAQPDDTAYMED